MIIPGIKGRFGGKGMDSVDGDDESLSPEIRKTASRFQSANNFTQIRSAACILCREYLPIVPMDRFPVFFSVLR